MNLAAASPPCTAPNSISVVDSAKEDEYPPVNEARCSNII